MMQTIVLNIENGIAVLTVNRPDSLNALNKQVITDLTEAVNSIDSDPSIRCVIVTGSGAKAFVAGADIKEIDQLESVDAYKFASAGQFLFSKIETLRMPVIAAVNGFALGGGLELALACDFIIAADDAKFGLPECTLGIMPGYGGTVRLVRRIGPARAKEIAMTGGFYSSAEAFNLGVINKVVPQAELMTTVQKMAQTIASRAPKAITAIKESIHQGPDLSLAEAFKLEAKLFSQLFGTSDQKEGTKAFIEKRKPVFTGK
jgi:enoyl-CoA hydratase